MTRPRVVITRPTAESRVLAARLEAIGIEPIIAPVMSIEPLPVVLPPGPIDAIVVTSAHGTAGLSAEDRQRLATTPVFAVGGATATAMRQGGFADVRIAGGDAAALADLIRLTQARRTRLLYLCGRVRKPALADMLAADGHDLIALETYDARPLAWQPETVAALRSAPPLACLHLSRRSAHLFVDAVRHADLGNVLSPAAHLCLSADVAEALRPWGPGTVVVADRPTTDSLLQAVTAIVAAAP